MKKTLTTILFSSALMVSLNGTAMAVSKTFTDLGVGKNITINDSIWNSRYSGGSPALGQGNEDNETERQVSGGKYDTYTGQKWDFEGMFWNSSSKVLTLIAGWDFANGVSHGSEKIQVGDLYIGSWGDVKTNYTQYKPSAVLDFSRDTDGSLTDGGTYNLMSGAFTSTTVTDITVASDPFEYDKGGTNKKHGSYTIGTVTGAPFFGWNGNDNHYFMQIDGLSDSDIGGDVLHITLGCGNDTGRGAAPVPEPSTFILLGAGLACAGLYRRKVRK